MTAGLLDSFSNGLPIPIDSEGEPSNQNVVGVDVDGKGGSTNSGVRIQIHLTGIDSGDTLPGPVQFHSKPHRDVAGDHVADLSSTVEDRNEAV